MHDITAGSPRALVIDDRMPIPQHDAGSNAILSHMRSLQRLGFDVALAPVTLQGDRAHLEAAGIAGCLRPHYLSTEDIFTSRRNAFSLVYMNRVATAERHVAIARETEPRARLVFSVVDLHRLRLAR